MAQKRTGLNAQPITTQQPAGNKTETSGFHCPKCKSPNTIVTDCRFIEEVPGKRRRRLCKVCNFAFHTWEQFDEDLIRQFHVPIT